MEKMAPKTRAQTAASKKKCLVAKTPTDPFVPRKVIGSQDVFVNTDGKIKVESDYDTNVVKIEMTEEVHYVKEEVDIEVDSTPASPRAKEMEDEYLPEKLQQIHSPDLVNVSCKLESVHLNGMPNESVSTTGESFNKANPTTVVLDKPVSSHSMELCSLTANECKGADLLEADNAVEKIDSKKGRKSKSWYSYRCRHCGQYFGNMSNLRRHAEDQHYTKKQVSEQDAEDRRTVCPFCLQNLAYKTSLVSHVLWSHTKKTNAFSPSIRCPFCSFVEKAGKTRKFRAHVRRHINKPHYQKKSEGKKSPRKSVVKKTVPRKRVVQMICQICSLVCKTKASYADHMIYKHSTRTDASSPSVKCPLCNFMGNFKEQKMGLYYHLVNEHWEGTGTHIHMKGYYCKLCGICCLSEADFKVHQNFHQKPFVFSLANKCQLCSKVFKNKYAFIKHMIYKHSTRTEPSSSNVKCAICDYMGNNKERNMGLYQHIALEHISLPL